jgi:hypothetical protein
MNDDQISPGAYLQKRIVQRTRKVAKTNDSAGYVAMWPEAVKEVLVKFPSLSSAEKSALRGYVEGQMQSMHARTRQDFTAAVQAVAQILGA